MKYNLPMLIPVAAIWLLAKIEKLFDRIRTIWILALWGVKAERGVLFQGKTLIRTRRSGDIRIGMNTEFNSTAKNNLVGLMTPTILDVRHGGKIIIGRRSGFSSVVMSSKTLITIGDDVKMGGNVRIFDHDFHSLDPRKRRSSEDRLDVRTKAVNIGDDVFIGTNAIILKGTNIGDRSIIAAGSVVFGLQVPPDSLVKGNPATIRIRSERI